MERTRKRHMNQIRGQLIQQQDQAIKEIVDVFERQGRLTKLC